MSESAPDTTAPGPAAPETTAPDPDAALLAELASKSGLLWLRPAGPDGAPGRAWPAWHVWHEGAVLVVSGPGEQQLPDLSGPLDLLLRSKDTGVRVLTVPARAEVLEPGSADWQDAAQALAASRLNSRYSPAELPQHWRDTGVSVVRVVAAGAPTERPGRYDASSGAAAPAPSPSTTSTWRPWHAGGRLRRLRRLRRRG